MTKPKNTISRKTERRKVALAYLNDNTSPGKDRIVAILEKRIASAPEGNVSTKKDRSKKRQS